MATGKHSARSSGSSAGGARHSSGTKKRHTGRNVAIALVIVVALVAAGLGARAFYIEENTYHGITGEVDEGELLTVTVESGATTIDIAEMLVNEGVVGSSEDFVNQVSEAGRDGELQAGTYEFTGGQDIGEIIDALASGQTASFTIPEGYTLEQIAERVGEETGVSEEEFYELASTGAEDYVDEYPFLEGAYEGTMEGFLFPSTYAIEEDMTADGLVREMLDLCQSELDGLDMGYAEKQGLDYYDVVTLASMIEKESRSSDDKADISSVFYNRLEKGMNLGSDVTTYYAVGKDLTEELTKSDLASDSPYNTRNEDVKGLPAGPICSPGTEALEAAAQPSDTDYLYFFWSSSKEKTMFFESDAKFDAAWEKYGE